MDMKHGEGCHHKTADSTPRYTDPVCGMNTDDPKAFTPYEHEGQTHYFCSGGCLAKFKENPAAYGRKR